MRFIIQLANELGIDLHGKKDSDLEAECLKKVKLLNNPDEAKVVK